MWIHRIWMGFTCKHADLLFYLDISKGIFVVNVIKNERIITCLCDVILNDLCYQEKQKGGGGALCV